MVSRLMLNLRREATRDYPVAPYKFSEGSEVPSVNLAPHYASKYAAPAAEPGFASTIIGNLGAPISHWGDSDEESDEFDRHRRDKIHNRKRMEDMELQLRAQRKIAVEVTEEVQVDVEDSGPYPPVKHGLPYS